MKNSFNIFKMLGLVALLNTGIVCADATDLPTDWVASSQQIISAIQNLQQAFDTDANLYQNLIASLQNVSPLLDATNASRQQTIACVTQTISNLKQNLTNTQNDTQAVVDNGNLELAYLTGQYAAVQASTDQTIADLNTQKISLQGSLDALNALIEESTGSSNQDAANFFDAINKLAASYDNAVNARQDFNTQLDTLLANVTNEDNAEIDQLNGLKNNIDNVNARSKKTTAAKKSRKSNK